MSHMLKKVSSSDWGPQLNMSPSLVGRESAEVFMRKLASQGNRVPEALELAISEVVSNPNPDNAYFYCRALPSGEQYGCNRNGDFFPESVLREHHGTFVKTAGLFRHHQSKMPRTGDVIESAYNDGVHAVDLLITAPRRSVEAEVIMLDKKATVATSMGASVPYDVCSYCGNKARTRMAYCDHLRNYMGKYINGRRVYAINTLPTFKDISLVVVPAAPESCIFHKVASSDIHVHKLAAMQKQLRSGFDESRPILQRTMVRPLSRLRAGAAIKTAHAALGVLRPDEFTAIIRQDARVLLPDYVPYLVREMNVPPLKLAGMVDQSTLELMKVAYSMPLLSHAELVNASQFMCHEEQEAYYSYRASLPDHEKLAFGGMFLR